MASGLFNPYPMPQFPNGNIGFAPSPPQPNFAGGFVPPVPQPPTFPGGNVPLPPRRPKGLLAPPDTSPLPLKVKSKSGTTLMDQEEKQAREEAAAAKPEAGDTADTSDSSDSDTAATAAPATTGSAGGGVQQLNPETYGYTAGGLLSNLMSGAGLTPQTALGKLGGNIMQGLRSHSNSLLSAGMTMMGWKDAANAFARGATADVLAQNQRIAQAQDMAQRQAAYNYAVEYNKTAEEGDKIPPDLAAANPSMVLKLAGPETRIPTTGTPGTYQGTVGSRSGEFKYGGYYPEKPYPPRRPGEPGEYPGYPRLPSGEPVTPVPGAAAPAPESTGAIRGGIPAGITWKDEDGKPIPTMVAAGMAGNIAPESKWNPYAVGDSGTSGGVFQHRKDRYDAGVNWVAGKYGSPDAWNDPNKQIAFAYHELKTKMPNVLRRMEQSATPEESAMHFANGFERPVPATARYGERRAAARRAFGQMEGESRAAPAAPAAAAPQRAAGSDEGKLRYAYDNNGNEVVVVFRNGKWEPQ